MYFNDFNISWHAEHTLSTVILLGPDS